MVNAPRMPMGVLRVAMATFRRERCCRYPSCRLHACMALEMIYELWCVFEKGPLHMLFVSCEAVSDIAYIQTAVLGSTLFLERHFVCTRLARARHGNAITSWVMVFFTTSPIPLPWCFFCRVCVSGAPRQHG